MRDCKLLVLHKALTFYEKNIRYTHKHTQSYLTRHIGTWFVTLTCGVSVQHYLKFSSINLNIDKCHVYCMNLGNQIQLYSKNEINRLMCHKLMGTSVSDWGSGDCPKKYFCVCILSSLKLYHQVAWLYFTQTFWILRSILQCPLLLQTMFTQTIKKQVVITPFLIVRERYESVTNFWGCRFESVFDM